MQQAATFPGADAPAPAPRPAFECVVSDPKPFVSVVIPVYKDATILESCLDHLSNQTYPTDRFEVVVVDNGSSFDLAGLFARRPGVSVIHCPKPGSYAARNRGVEAARGLIIAFTDADCQPHRQWLEWGVAAMQQEPEIAVLGGHVEVVPGSNLRMSAAELHQVLCAFRQERYLERQNFFATANVFTYKSVFEHVGPFDERLFSSGDLEWGQRAHARGCRMHYCADTVVRHPARTTMRQLFRKAARLTGGKFQLNRLRGESQLRTLKDILLRPLRRTLGDGPHVHLRWRDSTRFLAVDWALAAVRLLETVRLMAGGKPRRR